VVPDQFSDGQDDASRFPLGPRASVTIFSRRWDYRPGPPSQAREPQCRRSADRKASGCL